MQNKLFLIILVLIIITSCCNKHANKNDVTFIDTGEICIDPENKAGITFQTGKLNIRNTPFIVKCKAEIIPSPEEEVMVSVPISGFIKNLTVSPGITIQKGNVIAVIESPELVKLQEDFLIAKSNYFYYKEDFARQGELNLENATSMKIMQKAQLEFEKAEVNYQSLRKRLSLLGIKPDSIEVNKIQSILTIAAPIKGTVSQVKSVLGKFCTLGTTLCLITGNQHPQLKLSIKKAEAKYINQSARVEFKFDHSPDKVFQAALAGFEYDPEIDSLIIYNAKILTAVENIRVGDQVDCRIMGEDCLIKTIKTKEIIHLNNKSYLLKKSDDGCFKFIQIETGKSISDEIQIKKFNNESDTDEYVISGTESIMNNKN